jgi:hypothetical protein
VAMDIIVRAGEYIQSWLAGLKKLILILSLFFLLMCVHTASEFQQETQHKTLGEIYRKGVITFSRVSKISRDSFPSHIFTKNLLKLVQGKDRIYLTDIDLCDVKMLSPGGKFIKTFGTKGKGPSDLFAPGDMCLSEDRLVVWEIVNRRFSFFSLDGKFIKIEKLNSRGRLEGMKALDDGRIILEMTSVEVNKEKRFINDWRVLELYSSDMKYIKTIYRQKEHRYKYFKTPKPHYRLILPFTPKLSWDVLPGGKIALGYSDKYEIKIMDLDTGHTKIISRDYTPVKVTNIDKKKYLDMSIRYEKGIPKRGASKFVRDNVEFPVYKPVFKKLITDNEGHILVFVFSAYDQGENSLYAKSFDVFDSNGTFFNHVKINNNKGLCLYEVISISGNEFWCRETENEVDLVWVKYKGM